MYKRAPQGDKNIINLSLVIVLSALKKRLALR